MGPSRLERFKAAMKDDLDKLPDRPNASSPHTQPLEANDDAKNSARDSTKPPETPVEQSTAQTNSDQIAPPNIAFENLTVADDVNLDSDDSEAGCPIEIVPVLEDDEHTNEKNETPKGKEPAPEIILSHLGSKMQFGQATAYGEAFCPILPVAKYPYKFVPRANSQDVASAFFDNGQFWRREWDLFYVWPLDITDRPIVFIREEQFIQLLKDVGRTFKSLHIDPQESYFRIIKLVVDKFPNHQRMLPRYLGRSTSKDDYEALLSSAPSQRPFNFCGEPDPPRPPSDKQKTDFNIICEIAIDLARNKPKGMKNKRQAQRIIAQANLSKQLKRAQRYLGLRKKTEQSHPHAEAKFSLTEQSNKTKSQSESNYMPPLDLSRLPPYPFEDDVVIICVDVEAWEHSSSIITEVGIATLDTRDIHYEQPGESGENWRKKIRARHFRIRDHMMYENHEFVQGAADHFEKDFGTSEIIDLKDAPRIVAECFKEPFSKPLSKEEINSSWEKLSNNPRDSDPTPVEKRNIIFLGHNPSADIRYLHKLGYDPLNLSNLMETIDTAGLYRAHKKETNPRSVGNILAELGLVAWNLHNAGNDAVYTLWIMLATVVNEASKQATECESGGKGEEGEDEDKPEPKSRTSEPGLVVPEEHTVW